MSNEKATTEFYHLIRSFFIQCAEEQRLIVAPVFGQLKNVAPTGVVYFEYLHERLIQIDSIGVWGEQEDHFVTYFGFEGRECPMLMIKTRCHEEDLPALWQIRTNWFKTGIEPKDEDFPWVSSVSSS